MYSTLKNITEKLFPLYENQDLRYYRQMGIDGYHHPNDNFSLGDKLK